MKKIIANLLISIVLITAMSSLFNNSIVAVVCENLECKCVDCACENCACTSEKSTDCKCIDCACVDCGCRVGRTDVSSEAE